MLSICTKHVNHGLLVICIITFLIVFDICIARILSELSFFLVSARHTRMHGVSAHSN